MRKNNDIKLTILDKAVVAVPTALAAAALIYLNESYWHIGEIHVPLDKPQWSNQLDQTGPDDGKAGHHG